MLWVSKLIIDAVWAGFRRQRHLAHIWKLVALELASPSR